METEGALVFPWVASAVRKPADVLGRCPIVGFHLPNFLFNAVIYVGKQSRRLVFAGDSDFTVSPIPKSCELSCVDPAAKPAHRAEVVGHSSPAAVGVQPALKHPDPVCAPAGGLGGGEDGSLPPDPGAGTGQITVQKGALL